MSSPSAASSAAGPLTSSASTTGVKSADTARNDSNVTSQLPAPLAEGVPLGVPASELEAVLWELPVPEAVIEPETSFVRERVLLPVPERVPEAVLPPERVSLPVPAAVPVTDALLLTLPVPLPEAV